MTDEATIPGSEHVFLPNSYVLAVRAHPRTVEFDIDAVLTPDHPRYRLPLAGEHECYMRARLIFADVTRLEWDMRTVSVAIDASGEVDFGSIDLLSQKGSVYELEGDFGRMQIESGKAEFEIST